jgi:HEAT repeat protein
MKLNLFTMGEIEETDEWWGDQDLNVIITMLGDRNPMNRKLAATRCIQLGSRARPAINELLFALSDHEILVRIATAEALYTLGENQHSIRVLNEALRDRDVGARLQALHVLEKFGYVIDPALRFVDADDNEIF